MKKTQNLTIFRLIRNCGIIHVGLLGNIDKSVYDSSCSSLSDPVMDCQPVQDVPYLSPEHSWKRLQTYEGNWIIYWSRCSSDEQRQTLAFPDNETIRKRIFMPLNQQKSSRRREDSLNNKVTHTIFMQDNRVCVLFDPTLSALTLPWHFTLCIVLLDVQLFSVFLVICFSPKLRFVFRSPKRLKGLDH